MASITTTTSKRRLKSKSKGCSKKSKELSKTKDTSGETKDDTLQSDIDAITKNLGDVEIGTKPSGFLRQGSTNSKNLGSAAATSCPLRMGSTRKIPANEVVYIIASHGGFNDRGIFRGSSYPQGHNIYIKAAVKHWKDLNFGVLVSEGTNLTTTDNETRQSALQRHIEGIISGEINVFQRFPWKEGGPDASTAIFPNLIFTEGGGGEDPFVSTIVRYYNGNVSFFQLRRSVDAGRLFPFNNQFTYPLNYQFDSQNLGENSPVLLSQLLPLISNDIQENCKKCKINKTNIIFATCMDGVPQNIHNTWIGRNKDKPIVMGGGRKTKKRKRTKKPFSKKNLFKKKVTKRKKKRKKNRKTKTKTFLRKRSRKKNKKRKLNKKSRKKR